MWKQVEFELRARCNGFHLVTDEIVAHLPELPATGLVNLFIKHTSAALTINENADRDVRLGFINHNGTRGCILEPYLVLWRRSIVVLCD